MPQSTGPATNGKRHERRWAALLALAAVALVVLAAGFGGASSALRLSAASSAKLGRQVLVNPQGRTLYVLTPETARHLLCKSPECLASWPPVLVRSARAKLKAGPGVHGRLGVLRRRNGRFQVTLRGLPLYRYAGDSAKGQVNGEGIESFGGVWHAASPSGSSGGASGPSAPGTASAPAPAPAPAPSAPEPQPEPYKY